MSEECTHDCSSCGASCDHNAEAKDLIAPLNKDSAIKHVYAIMSGKGGVGKSSTTACLASAMAKKGYKVGIMDADITGPSIPTAFGLNHSFSDILTGIILFFIIGSEFFISYKISFRKAAKKEG